MPLDMIDAQQRFFTPGGHALGRIYAHQQRAHQSRTACNRDAIQIVHAQMRFLQRRIDNAVNHVHMPPGSHLRKDAPIAPVNINLRGHDV